MSFNDEVFLIYYPYYTTDLDWNLTNESKIH